MASGNLYDIFVADRRFQFLEFFCYQRNPELATVFGWDCGLAEDRMFESFVKIGDHVQGIGLCHNSDFAEKGLKTGG